MHDSPRKPPVLGPSFLERPPRMMFPMFALGVLMVLSGMVAMSISQTGQFGLEAWFTCCGLFFLAPAGALVVVQLLSSIGPDTRLRIRPGDRVVWRVHWLDPAVMQWRPGTLRVTGQTLRIECEEPDTEGAEVDLAQVQHCERRAAPGLYYGGFVGMGLISLVLHDGVLDVRTRGARRLRRELEALISGLGFAPRPEAVF